jgi:hypothetical protein
MDNDIGVTGNLGQSADQFWQGHQASAGQVTGIPL